MSASLIVLAVLLVLGLLASSLDRRSWNGGICAATGEPWVRFDTDSQGGRGYRSGEHVTWISWPGIDSGYRVIDGVTSKSQDGGKA